MEKKINKENLEAKKIDLNEEIENSLVEEEFNLKDILSIWLPKWNKKGRRVGRGSGSSKGKTCGLGQKGAGARSGGKKNKMGFEGGQTPVHRRLPKVGFTSLYKRFTYDINVSRFPGLDIENIELIKKQFKIPHYIKTVKFFGNGLNKKVELHK